MKTRSLTLACALVLGLAPACDDNDGGDDANMEDGGDDGSNCTPMPEATFSAADESSCAAAASDFVPGSDSDPYPACMVDDGAYHLIADTPSSIARVEAFETIMDMLADSPTADDFVMARTEYALDEGLESRLVRREDLHYPPIPMSDFDPDFEDDKQCSAPSNVDKHPDRCAGPAKIAPIIDAAFVAGIQEDGAPEIQVAKIEAAAMWFFLLSAYKEANTCITKSKDCDSSWAYYTGGFERGSGGIGLAEEVAGLSDMAHQRIFDGISAVRCWREAYPIEDYPTRDDLPTESEELLSNALEQLDNALWYGYARLVRDRIEQHDQVCGTEAEASLAFLQIAGPVLDFEANERGAAEASTLASFWNNDAPTAADLEAAVAAIDAVFPCPQR